MLRLNRTNRSNEISLLHATRSDTPILSLTSCIITTAYKKNTTLASFHNRSRNFNYEYDSGVATHLVTQTNRAILLLLEGLFEVSR